MKMAFVRPVPAARPRSNSIRSPLMPRAFLPVIASLRAPPSPSSPRARTGSWSASPAPARSSDAARRPRHAARRVARAARLRNGQRRAGVAHPPAGPRNQRRAARRQDRRGRPAVFPDMMRGASARNTSRSCGAGRRGMNSPWTRRCCARARRGPRASGSSARSTPTAHPPGRGSRRCAGSSACERPVRAWCARRPETGRLHQIRVHLAHTGHPVVGDKIYGPDEGCYLEFIDTGWTPRARPASSCSTATPCTPTGSPSSRNPAHPTARSGHPLPGGHGGFGGRRPCRRLLPANAPRPGKRRQAAALRTRA